MSSFQNLIICNLLLCDFAVNSIFSFIVLPQNFIYPIYEKKPNSLLQNKINSWAAVLNALSTIFLLPILVLLTAIVKSIYILWRCEFILVGIAYLKKIKIRHIQKQCYPSNVSNILSWHSCPNIQAPLESHGHTSVTSRGSEWVLWHSSLYLGSVNARHLNSSFKCVFKSINRKYNF